MKWKNFGTLGISTLMLLSGCSNENQVVPQSVDAIDIDESNAAQEIGPIIDTYARAVTDMNRDLFLTLWADPDAVSIVSPIGRIRSRSELGLFFDGLQDTYRQLDLQFSNVAIRSEGSAGWATFDFTVDAVGADGQGVQFGGWETQFYRRTDNGWGIAHVHYSVPPPQPGQE